MGFIIIFYLLLYTFQILYSKKVNEKIKSSQILNLEKKRLNKGNFAFTTFYTQLQTLGRTLISSLLSPFFNHMYTHTLTHILSFYTIGT